ncbi:nuclear transport factor 2 family protein [Colwelliaceae bacterium BS250]
MFNAITNLYCHGDIKALKEKLLHTTAWQQHDYTAYGETQLQQFWLQSLQDFGFGQLIDSQQIDDGQYGALVCQFKGQNSDDNVRLTFQFEHNKQYIKRVHCIVDSYSYQNHLQCDDQQLIKQLPSADPLIIAKFDHQLHPESFHAKPSDINDSLNSNNKSLVDSWWTLWQQQDFPIIKDIYSDDCIINLPSPVSNHDNSDGSDASELRDFVLRLAQQLNRRYCQLERVIVDNQNSNNIAIAWQIDGDFNDNGAIKRIKIPVQTIFTINDGKISTEHMVIDWHSLMKRFDLSTSIL